MKKRLTGVAFVLVLALTSLAFAKGPPVPEGCVFERGTTTCTEIDRVEVGRIAGDREVTVWGICPPTVDGSPNALQKFDNVNYSVTTTVSTYRGVSHVQKVDPVVTEEYITEEEILQLECLIDS